MKSFVAALIAISLSRQALAQDLCEGDCDEPTSLLQHKVSTEQGQRFHAADEAIPADGETDEDMVALIQRLAKEYPFQPVQTDRDEFVNIILVRTPFEPFGNEQQERLYHQYKDKILFLGISSWETFPLPSPYATESFPADKYLGMFPGFLHMMHDPDSVFPGHVKTLLLSQSDFALPTNPVYAESPPKEYDFVYAASHIADCNGWGAFVKNWTFATEALEVMCREYNFKGVLVGTTNEETGKPCSIPKVCEGKMLQTTYIEQEKFFEYAKKSKFSFLPQVYDASPRVATQALTMDLPVLMNRNIAGGWKYVNKQTGEFFNDMSDFRSSLDRLMANIDAGQYSPRKWVFEHYGKERAGLRLMGFIEQHFSDRVTLPTGTKWLYPAGV